MLVSSASLVFKLTYSKSHHHHHGHGSHIPPDLTLLDCPDLEPEDGEGETSVHLELPVTSENIFLLSRGSYSVGVVYLTQSEDIGDVIDVNINVFYDREAGKHLDLAKVCTVSRPDGENGIGIFVSTSLFLISADVDNHIDTQSPEAPLQPQSAFRGPCGSTQGSPRLVFESQEIRGGYACVCAACWRSVFSQIPRLFGRYSFCIYHRRCG